MNFHEHHCQSCFKTSCISTDCPVQKCRYCHIPLHCCKLEDHIELICRKATVPCPNHDSGCKKQVVRDKIAVHLPICPASVVVCSRDRCRKLNVKTGKLELKHLGRQCATSSVNHEDLDVQLAIFDQNMIIENYNASRNKRVKQRDPIHPTEPLIPLRIMPFDTTQTTEGLDDSSEDEMIAKREKMKKSRMVFANCYMCQVDPSVQHLHTLGNGADIEKLKKRRRTPQVLDRFHEKLNLKVSIAVENAPETVLKSENIREIKKGGTFYTLKCLKTVRRSEFGDHALSQHTQSIDQLNEMVLRCPNWASGCSFSASRIQVKTGKLRFHPHSATLSHEVDTDTQDSHKFSIPSSNWKTLETLPLWVYEYLSIFLPSSALYNLSLTSRKLREIVGIGCHSRCYVEPVWEKKLEDGKWEQTGFVWRLSATEAPPELEWTVPVKLSHHISKCAYFKPIEYDKPIPVFPQNLESDIWKGFSNELSERLIRAEVLQVPEE